MCNLGVNRQSAEPAESVVGTLFTGGCWPLGLLHRLLQQGRVEEKQPALITQRLQILKQEVVGKKIGAGGDRVSTLHECQSGARVPGWEQGVMAVERMEQLRGRLPPSGAKTGVDNDGAVCME